MFREIDAETDRRGSNGFATAACWTAGQGHARQADHLPNTFWIAPIGSVRVDGMLAEGGPAPSARSHGIRTMEPEVFRASTSAWTRAASDRGAVSGGPIFTFPLRKASNSRLAAASYS